MKRNNFEIIGNIVAQPISFNGMCFIKIGIWQNKEKTKQREGSSNVVTIMVKKPELIERLNNVNIGQSFNINGWISSYKSKRTGYFETSLLANEITILNTEKNLNYDTQLNI